MNKKMRDLRAKIAELFAKAKVYREDGEIDKANGTMDEIEALEKEYALEARMFEAEKKAVDVPAPTAAPGGEDEEDADDEPPAEAEGKKSGKRLANAIKSFAAAARRGFVVNKTMNEGTAADGGYTVPEDIVTQIEHFREAKVSLLSLVTVVPVKKNKGRRTFKKRSQQTGFVKVGEGGKISKKNTPQYSPLEYKIEKYAGYFPVTDELLEDSDANIVNELTAWIADESRVTANRLILEQIATKSAVQFASLDDIKKALNVTLGAAFKSSSRVITNDSGLHWLDTLKDNDNRYLLQPSPADAMKLQLCAGGTVVPVEVIPENDMPSAAIYGATKDADVIAGKTYYTRSGEEGAYVYEEVKTPTKTNISTYYEVTGLRVPIIVGDLKEGIVYWDRKQMNIKASDVATAGELNAYEEDLTLFRAIEREDVTVRDTDAFVNGYITVTAV